MNTVHKGLKEYAKSHYAAEEEREQFYQNYAIDYLSERVESIIINLDTLDQKEEFVRQVEKCLDEFEGVY